MVGRILAFVFTLLWVTEAVHAQPAGQTRHLGILLYDGAPPGFVEAFRNELRALGHVEGKNLSTETRNAAGRTERLGGLADELVRLKVDVILTMNTPAAQAARKATTTIPIVMARAGDPVRSGLVSSLAHPGGNVTGLSYNNADLGPKRIQLLREILPAMSRLAVLSNVDNSGHTPQIPEMERACSDLGLKLQSLPVRGPSDFPAAFQAAARARAEALVVLDDTTFTRHRAQILKLAGAQRMPVVSRYRDFVEAGALIAYGPSLPAVYRRTAHYVDRILKGARPGDLPIEEPTEFDLVVNLRTARALGLKIPRSVLLIATHVIE
jgi:putative tryptophan/tyrosine transport system substrate-binding protein